MESGLNMAYLYKLYVVVDDDSENLFHQNAVDEVVYKAIEKNTDVHFVGSIVSELNGDICGKCCKCGAWVSDQALDNHIEGFSDGCFIDGKWWCDLCLPQDHLKKF